MSGIVHWEIPTTDLAASRAFYEGLFGWTFEPFSPSYLMFHVDEGVGGALTLVDAVPAACIEVYISVADLEAALDRARELGGTVAEARTEIGNGMGYWAAIEDPCGCRIALWSRD